MEFYYGIIILLVIYIIYSEVKKRKNKTTEIISDTKEISSEEKLPYRRKLLLTKNEWAFYKGLKPIADELGYSILAKIRVADLVEVTAKDHSEWQTYFNKINKKHIDFALAKPENLQIELLIELDDSTHNEKQAKRDEFIDRLYNQTGYKLLRVRGSGNVKEKIQTVLKPTEDETVIKEQPTETAAQSEQAQTEITN